MIVRLQDWTPQVDPTCYVADNATIIGQVTIGRGASVWFNAVVRGDMAPITIGEDTNVQDLAMVHVDHRTPTVIGDRVVVGHHAIVHGATVEADCIIGMGAILLNRSQVGHNCIVAAGSVVREDFVVPAGSLIAGVPAVVKRPLTPEEIERIRRNVADYAARAQLYRGKLAGPK
ncbi:MAG: gamma carbonic anhydrase family protein [candidate division WOR-3 bacterium]|nr:gamma carbonic anhydrase family protein [candidate division WOR-3 bacterium]